MDGILPLDRQTTFVLLNTLIVIIGVTATVHILLRKSDPKAALLWISLVWLAPIIGAVTYVLFGINRLDRRARRLVVPPLLTHEQTGTVPKSVSKSAKWAAHDRLARAVSHLNLTSGNDVEIYEGVADIHDAMIHAIRSAKNSILLSTYIFRKGELGRSVAEALIEADQRGVDVKVLLDGVGAGYLRSRLFYEMKKGGVEVRRFMHSFWPWRMPYLNLRTHRKWLIIDAETVFTGSANIGFVRNLETQFKITGPVVEQCIDMFDFDWRLTGGPPVDLATSPLSNDGSSILFRGIPSGPIYPRERLRLILMAAIGRATDRIRILTPYFIPDNAMVAELVLASLRGVSVEIYLPKKSNYFFADWAARWQLQELLNAGCQVYLRDHIFDHSKMMTLDGEWALIGSSNWDARSFRLNFEYDLECYSPEFVSKLDKIIDQRRDASEEIDPIAYRQRSALKKLKESAARLLLPYL